jgi:hypothetical protein
LTPEPLNFIVIIIVTMIGPGDFSSSDVPVSTFFCVEILVIPVEGVVVHVQGIGLAYLARGPVDEVPLPVYPPRFCGVGASAHTVSSLARFTSRATVGAALLLQFARGWRMSRASRLVYLLA